MRLEKALLPLVLLFNAACGEASADPPPGQGSGGNCADSCPAPNGGVSYRFM
jgi:hypothetical protein